MPSQMHVRFGGQRVTANSTEAFSELYSAYAAGCLDPAFALLVETQAALRGDVRRAIDLGEMIAGAFLQRESVSGLSRLSAEDVLDQIDALEPASGKNTLSAVRAACGAMDELVALPEPVRSHAIEAAGAEGWQFSGPGIRRMTLDVGGVAETELYRIEPGVTVPRHTHAGQEFTLVIAGGFTDETGSYGPGDLVMKGPDDIHRPIGDPGEACYALAVRDGALRFTGVAGVVQRLLGR